MYLLKLKKMFVTLANIRNLHSTMYLLKPMAGWKTSDMIEFTFHYVSIKTSMNIYIESYLTYLHSTMYLLKPDFDYNDFKNGFAFTFHYVSIKTPLNYYLFCYYNNIYIPLCIY